MFNLKYKTEAKGIVNAIASIFYAVCMHVCIPVCKNSVGSLSTSLITHPINNIHAYAYEYYVVDAHQPYF